MLTGESKLDVVRRLRRVEGQVRGVAEMIESERYCIDVLTQIAAIQAALRAVGRQVVENHLVTCVEDAVDSGDAARKQRILTEFVETMYKFVR